MKRFVHFGIVVMCAALIGLAGSAQAATTADSVATVTINPTIVTFKAVAENDGLMLTVSGPDGYYYSRSFERGMAPTLAAVADGSRLVDGLYTYEIKAIPLLDQEARKALSQARAEGSDPLRTGLLPERTPRQTGRFMVHKGGFVVPTGAESVAKDIVHADDVIVDGSLCVGNDCYNGLAFGFDTIALMENNLRIFFDDTSTIQNYPRNDWRIICNDSTDSGGNYFAIEDATEVSNILVLEAGAPDNSLYVDSHGDVGINTSTPYYELHIVDGDSPAVRLDQDGSYGWTPQKWDLCGNESNFFIRDATHASKLPFRIEPDAPTDSIFIKTNGNIGMGTGAPSKQLEIETTGENASLLVERTDGAECYMNATTGYGNFGTATNHPFRLAVNSDWKMRLDSDGSLTMRNGATCTSTGVWTDLSSRELKTNIRELETDVATAALRQLNPVRFNYKADLDEEYVGFIAEDVPDLVATADRKGMSSMDVVAVLTKVVQQQQEALSFLEQERARMNAELEQLRRQLQGQSK